MISAVFLCLILAVVTTSGGPVSGDCGGEKNTKPIIKDEPTLVSTTTNGKRYVVGSGYNKINIVHLYGAPYEMGQALGTLMKDELNMLIAEYFLYLEKQIDQILKIVPPFIAQWISEKGLKGALDLNYEITRLYTPPWYDEEMKGIEAGSGVSYEDIRRLNLLPELIKAACSVIGAWGNSLSESKREINTSLLHLRALDWDKNAPIAKYATIVVYHPSASYSGYGNLYKYYKHNYASHAMANFGYPGLVGSITAYSEASVGLGEKVWITAKGDDITTRLGNPWTYVLRDVAQFSSDLETALTMMINAKRTCSIHLGLGAVNRNQTLFEEVQFRGVEYSEKELNFYNWNDMFENRGHPLIKDIVYWDKHVQPSDNPCLSSLLTAQYGNLDAETLIREVTSVSETGDTMNAIFDYGENAVYIAYSAPQDPEGPLEAYKRSHTRIDMGKLFNEKL